jgi:lauroyl/myristoyl acyltransferase
LSVALAKHSRSSPLIGVAARATLAAAAVLPMAAIQRLGSLLGSLAWRVPGRLREVSRLNVAMCLPELSREQRDRMVRLSLQETGRTAVEMAAVCGGCSTGCGPVGSWSSCRTRSR